jgi:hypothetical protein
MDIDLVQAQWLMGLLPPEQIPEFGAQAMMQGFDGPNILELASFHRPNRWDIKPEVFDGALREMGRAPISDGQAVLVLSRLPSRRFLRDEIDLDRFEVEIRELADLMEAPDRLRKLCSCLWALSEQRDGDRRKRELLVEFAWEMINGDPGR